MDWFSRIIEKTKTDFRYQECYQALQKTEEEFLQIRDALPPEQREQLNNYISACEEMDYIMLRLAYLVGKEDQEG